MTTLVAFLIAAGADAPVGRGGRSHHAMVRAQVMRKGAVGAKDSSGEYVLVDLWAREEGAWRLRHRVVARPVAPLSH